MSRKFFNSHLERMQEDTLYHLGFSTASMNIPQLFGDVKFVFLGGSAERMQTFGKLLARKMKIDGDLVNLAENGGRFVLFKVGEVLIANHGMGTPSTSIILHELIKLLQYAGRSDVTFVRIGTCGGLGIPPGSLVITNEALNTKLQPNYELCILGKSVCRKSHMDASIINLLKHAALKVATVDRVIVGKTITANDFYEEQARTDGAFCEFSEGERAAYIKQIWEQGVRNIEMECLCISAICHAAGFKVGVICVTVVDRLKTDQVTLTKEESQTFQELPFDTVFEFLHSQKVF